MFSVMILDDENIQRNTIISILKRTYSDWNFISVENYQEAKESLSCTDFQLFLLDIRLSSNIENTDGLDFGRYIRTIPAYKHVPIIFLSALSDKVLPALQEIHCSSYLIKPYNPKQLLDAVAYAFQTPRTKPASLTLKDSNGVFQHVPPAAILYIESDKKNLILHTNKYPITVANYSFAKILDLLPENFIQCHRKYIINREHYTSYDRSLHLIHINDTVLPVGRKYKEDLERRLNL